QGTGGKLVTPRMRRGLWGERGLEIGRCFGADLWGGRGGGGGGAPPRGPPCHGVAARWASRACAKVPARSTHPTRPDESASPNMDADAESDRQRWGCDIINRRSGRHDHRGWWRRNDESPSWIHFRPSVLHLHDYGIAHAV